VDALSYLFGLEKLGIKFGLENIGALCEALGHPQRAYPTVIIAGTNGKGSVAAMVETGLRAAGLRTGLYTSPHLVRLEERFTIGGEPVDHESMVGAAAWLQATVEQLRWGGKLAAQPTFFEVTTAMGFELFRRAAVEVAVLEVGLGGRFDATNVAEPIAGAITTVDFDHERFLGRTIGRIAFEKAGVVKPGMHVVVGERKPEAVEVIARNCAERNARLVMAHEGVAAGVSVERGRVEVDLRTPAADYGRLRLSLRGRHQFDNALVAVRLLEQLGTLGLPVTRGAIVAAVEDTRWPGRLDLRRDAAGREVLCDAAHNPAGAGVLAAYLREAHPAGLPMVFAVMRDKDVPGILAPLLPFASPLVLTAPPMERAMPPEAIADVVRRAGTVAGLEVEPDPGAALERAWTHGPTVCVCGSIFLVGDVLGRLEPRRG